jgi:hypothetical protein
MLASMAKRAEPIWRQLELEIAADAALAAPAAA